jgi:hypothetical protein
MNSIVKSAIKSVKHYKHVVYFLENFIKHVCLKLKHSIFLLLLLFYFCFSVNLIIKLLVYMLSMQLFGTQDINIYKNDLFEQRFSKNLYKTFTY